MKIISRKGMIILCLTTICSNIICPISYCVIHSKSYADIYLYGSSPDGKHYAAVKMFYALLISEVS